MGIFQGKYFYIFSDEKYVLIANIPMKNEPEMIDNYFFLFLKKFLSALSPF